MKSSRMSGPWVKQSPTIAIAWSLKIKVEAKSALGVKAKAERTSVCRSIMLLARFLAECRSKVTLDKVSSPRQEQRFRVDTKRAFTAYKTLLGLLMSRSLSAVNLPPVWCKSTVSFVGCRMSTSATWTEPREMCNEQRCLASSRSLCWLRLQTFVVRVIMSFCELCLFLLTWCVT